MANKKGNLKPEEIEQILTKNSVEVTRKFLLENYAKSSFPSMRSAIYILLYGEIEKHEIADLTFEDYQSIFSEDNTTSQMLYKKRFFEFLYAFDYLKNPNGFESVWIKEKSIKSFKKEKKSRGEVKKIDALTLEELMLIQNAVEVDSTKIETLKMQFCWYALFELGLPVEEVRKEIKSNNYSNGQLQIKEGVFDLPLKFQRMFDGLSNNSNHNGFRTLDYLIENLGIDAGLERKLIPTLIKNTRKVTFVTCPNCLESYSNEAHNWTSINNRIVCVSCAESLKKKIKTQIDERTIENTNVDTKQSQDLSVLFTFEELKREIKNKKVDYLKLHEIQMEIGNLGEAYVYQKECEKLKNTKYLHMIDERKARNPENGYDILSYTIEGKPLHIEVKTTVGKEDTFFLSEHERMTAEKLDNYVIYFVKEIMSDEPQLEIIENINSNELYTFGTKSWVVSKKFL